MHHHSLRTDSTRQLVITDYRVIPAPPPSDSSTPPTPTTTSGGFHRFSFSVKSVRRLIASALSLLGVPVSRFQYSQTQDVSLNSDSLHFFPDSWVVQILVSTAFPVYFGLLVSVHFACVYLCSHITCLLTSPCQVPVFSLSALLEHRFRS